MSIRLKGKRLVRLISFCLAGVFIIIGSAIAGFNLASRYRTAIEYGYQRSLNQLSDYFSTIRSTLTKGVYANTSSQQYGLASKLMVEAEGAKNSLSQLPLKEGEAEALQKYLTQVGDFSSFMIGTLSRNESLSKENLEAFSTLAEYADNIGPQIEELSARYGDGSTSISTNSFLKGNIQEDEEKIEQVSFENSFTNLSESFTDYPTLIYDGPFADQVQQKEPRLTKNAEGFSVDEAKKNAARFLNISADALKYKEARKGNVPAYVFTGDDGNIFITVTIKGGYIGEMYDNSPQESYETLEYKVLAEKAKDFLKQHKITDMTESYYVTANDVCTINYAYKSGDAICYSDLIKIGVSTKTGKIVSFNSDGYIMNHTDRTIEKPSLSVNEAKKSVSDKLKIETTALALIPTGGTKEVLCYEFTCKGQNDDRVLVYINCKTGLEEQIFILLQSDGGTLVM